MPARTAGAERQKRRQCSWRWGPEKQSRCCDRNRHEPKTSTILMDGRADAYKVIQSKWIRRPNNGATPIPRQLVARQARSEVTEPQVPAVLVPRRRHGEKSARLVDPDYYRVAPNQCHVISQLQQRG